MISHQRLMSVSRQSIYKPTTAREMATKRKLDATVGDEVIVGGFTSPHSRPPLCIDTIIDTIEKEDER